MINWINEYNLTPGVYEHYKGTLYIVQNLITHHEVENEKWEKMRDPEVVFRTLENEYLETPTGKREVIRHFKMPLSKFVEDVEVAITKPIKGGKTVKTNRVKKVPRFKQA